MFTYAVETDRRFYLANDVNIVVHSAGQPTHLEVTLTDAWVWDMYRSARFVPSVTVHTFRDVNVERLPETDELQP
jgi:Tfp pilus assembly protein PilZ